MHIQNIIICISAFSSCTVAGCSFRHPKTGLGSRYCVNVNLQATLQLTEF